MVVGIEPPLSPHGPEGPALALTVSGLLVLNGALGLQLLWLVLVVLIAVARRNLDTLSLRFGPDGGGGAGGDSGGSATGPSPSNGSGG